MTERQHYLVAYDVRSRRRLPRVHRLVVASATGGRKSVYECRLSPAERRQFLVAVGPNSTWRSTASCCCALIPEPALARSAPRATGSTRP